MSLATKEVVVFNGPQATKIYQKKRNIGPDGDLIWNLLFLGLSLYGSVVASGYLPSFLCVLIFGAIYLVLTRCKATRKAKIEQAYKSMTSTGAIRVFFIPNGFQKYWEQTIEPRRHELESLGGKVPDWDKILSENYDVVSICIPLHEYIENELTGDEMKKECEERIWQEFYFLGCRLIDDLKEMKEPDKRAHNEGVQAYLNDLP